MPLSEHEQRLLEQMERALYAEDPKFASSLRGKDPRSNFRRRVLLAGFGFVIGVVLLMTGLVAQIIIVSVLGFLLMLASAFFAVTSYRAVSAAAQLGVVDPSGVRRAPHPAAGGRKARGHGGFMARVEERWNRRRDDNGR
ncbi:MAG TPA: DUF3040 domain-containing protein [Actinomycetes bacterium]|nr:DUF3040 domain-containing protein [Actinomycetes bacterium]